MTLTEILTQYRAGERGLPTYAELIEIERQHEQIRSTLADLIENQTGLPAGIKPYTTLKHSPAVMVKMIAGALADHDGHAAINAKVPA